VNSPHRNPLIVNRYSRETTTMAFMRSPCSSALTLHHERAALRPDASSPRLPILTALNCSGWHDFHAIALAPMQRDAPDG